MSNQACFIFGLKEVSWPKGCGYLYFSFSDKLDGRPLAYFDLYKTSDEEFRSVLTKILPTVLAGTSQGHELVNFSTASAAIFREVEFAIVRNPCSC